VKIKDPGILKKKEYNLTEYLGANIKRGIYKSFFKEKGILIYYNGYGSMFV